jgi:sialic acid synthase SpsE/sugar phosphate isomerase/epimerase
MANPVAVKNTFLIDGHEIGGSRTFVIAEIGNNHQGDLQMAKDLVDAAQAAGADCVKFQLRNREALYRHRADDAAAEDLGAEYIQDLLTKVDLTLDQHRQLRAYCKAKGITYMCTPWDELSVDELAQMDVPALKIASADLCNPYLIRKAATLGVPLILSTGMSYEHEIIRAVEDTAQTGVSFALLHCNSTYPAPESDIQLPYIGRLKQIHPFVGYSGHERGTAITIAAVALGACIVERHITLDRRFEGPDHLASLEPGDFKQLVDGIRSVEQAFRWEGPARNVSQGELLNRENLAKSVIAARSIAEGEVFSSELLRVASPGQGLAPYRLPELVGKQASRPFNQGDFLFVSDITGKTATQRSYSFPLKWGIPVRYHDFAQFAKSASPDLFEFHLSYRDLAVDPEPYLHVTDCTRLVVHSPELFENSELLDLAAEDETYRERSIRNLQRVVDVTLRIAKYFPNADSFLIVANVGGFSADTQLPKEYRNILYERFMKSFSKVKWGGTELIPQNMAPFPWHFGGQRYQNIFMLPQEIAEQATANNLRICLDLSHLQMTCNHFGLNFIDEIYTLLPFVAHMHISDAKGTNGEGVSLGDGDVPWRLVWPILKAATDAGFIPEAWQGHKNHGEGFWETLEYLSNIK